MNIINEFDTIAAISTPMGFGGVGVIRISGDKALEIIGKIFKTFKLALHINISLNIYYINVLNF